MSTAELTRNEILNEIAQHETRLEELRAMLPSCMKTVYRFRTRPERYTYIYAINREQAERRLHERMAHRKTEWSLASTVVDAFHDPAIAVNQCRGNLLTYLTEREAREFAQDYRASQAGKTNDRPKDAPKSQLERDVEDWEANQRRKSQK